MIYSLHLELITYSNTICVSCQYIMCSCSEMVLCTDPLVVHEGGTERKTLRPCFIAVPYILAVVVGGDVPVFYAVISNDGITEERFNQIDGTDISHGDASLSLAYFHPDPAMADPGRNKGNGNGANVKKRIQVFYFCVLFPIILAFGRNTGDGAETVPGGTGANVDGGADGSGAADNGRMPFACFRKVYGLTFETAESITGTGFKRFIERHNAVNKGNGITIDENDGKVQNVRSNGNGNGSDIIIMV